MQTLNARALRSAIPHLENLLALEHELVITQRGKPIARIVQVAQPSALGQMAAIRALCPPMKARGEQLVRDDRDRRDS